MEFFIDPFRAIGTAFTELLLGWGLNPFLVDVIGKFLVALILILFGVNLVILLIWLERKIISRMQIRLGPNRVGPFGLLQPGADALKLLTKELITPQGVEPISYNLAPALAVFASLMLLVVIPFGPGLIAADINVGVLYFIAVGSISVMAILMAGWGSNNKYALLGGFRVVAQMFSYEIPLIMSALVAVVLAGTMRMNGLVEAQGSFFGLGWFVWVAPAALIIFFISSLAESERTPFDLLEAESEIVAGFHIEYSGMKFAWFFLAQFLNSFILSALAATVFLGGWQGPGAEQIPILGVFYFVIKTFIVYFLMIWVRGTFPRLRIDQMMALAWKVLVPASIVLVLWAAIVIKLPVPGFVQGVLNLVGNLVVIAVIAGAVGRALRRGAGARARWAGQPMPVQAQARS